MENQPRSWAALSRNPVCVEKIVDVPAGFPAAPGETSGKRNTWWKKAPGLSSPALGCAWSGKGLGAAEDVRLRPDVSAARRGKETGDVGAEMTQALAGRRVVVWSVRKPCPQCPAETLRRWKADPAAAVGEAQARSARAFFPDEKNAAPPLQGNAWCAWLSRRKSARGSFGPHPRPAQPGGPPRPTCRRHIGGSLRRSRPARFVAVTLRLFATRL